MPKPESPQSLTEHDLDTLYQLRADHEAKQPDGGFADKAEAQAWQNPYDSFNDEISKRELAGQRGDLAARQLGETGDTQSQQVEGALKIERKS